MAANVPVFGILKTIPFLNSQGKISDSYDLWMNGSNSSAGSTRNNYARRPSTLAALITLMYWMISAHNFPTTGQQQNPLDGVNLRESTLSTPPSGCRRNTQVAIVSLIQNTTNLVKGFVLEQYAANDGVVGTT